MAMLSAKQVSELLGYKISKSYTIIRELNKELEEKGYRVRNGMIIDSYLYSRFGLDKKNEDWN